MFYLFLISMVQNKADIKLFAKFSCYYSVTSWTFFKHLCAYQIVPVYFVSPEKKTFAEIVEPFIPVR